MSAVYLNNPPGFSPEMDGSSRVRNSLNSKGAAAFITADYSGASLTKGSNAMHDVDARTMKTMSDVFDKIFDNAAFVSSPTPDHASKINAVRCSMPDRETEQRMQRHHNMAREKALRREAAAAAERDAAAADREEAAAAKEAAAAADRETPAAKSHPSSPSSLFDMFSRGTAERSDPWATEHTLVLPFHADEDTTSSSSGSLKSTAATWEVETKALIYANMREDAYNRPGPPHDLIRCYVRRVRNLLGSCCFQLWLEHGDVFIMAGRRRKKSKVSSFVISQDLDDLKRDTENCIAKLKANFTGTEYMLRARGSNKDYASERMCVTFKQCPLSVAGGPRTMHIALPAPDRLFETDDAAEGTEGLHTCLELAKQRELPPCLEGRLMMLTSKQPHYEESSKGYVLDFHGRVNEASVKNFQLVNWDHNSGASGQELVMQFGRINSDHYALDFGYPLSLHTAFAVALASIDTKLCYSV